MSGHEAPVLVVGAGPVGMVAALLLARHGVPSVVVEASAERDPTGSKSICVQRDVLDIYDRVGVADELVAEGVYWQVARTYYAEQELFATTFPAAGQSAYPPWINLGQQRIEELLAARVAGEPLVDLRFGHHVVALRQDAEGVTVRCTTPTGPVDLTGTHLVAADGAASTVRNMLWLDFPGQSFGDRFLIADIRAELPFPAERRFHFDPPWNPGRQVLLHPQPDSVWRIDWQVPEDYDLAADTASGRLDERIRRIVGGAPYEVQWLSVYRFHQRLASRMLVGRVLLAGDAAHLMSPFGARGLNSGVQDAENAAWKIAFDRRGDGGPALLPSYEHERLAAARENLRVTGDTMRFLVPQDEAEARRRREILQSALRDPAARRLVNSGKLAEPYWYVDSPLTSGPPPADFPVAPGVPRPPVAGVLCPDGPLTGAGEPSRVRRLFGSGFVLLRGAAAAGAPDTTPNTTPDTGPGTRPDTGPDTGPGTRPDTGPDTRPDRAPGAAPGAGPDLPVHTVTGPVAEALDARPDRVFLIRPDGYLAAVLDAPTPTDLRAALHRASGRTDDSEGDHRGPDRVPRHTAAA
ncbi:FAD-dependent monooxygenase [Dactylosporangium siamense]|uniref:FAD-dependent oxidoreductase n=1 Tax=Dactylosporangium siamense TaxID=685454 RepID=A0A919PER1_9ACTN|nr:FAD-dependent monooxygenase [Dactylosporangium siamense]GIG42584.1 FAD-dependent oxidoreductase [Dactylosporangium siamense]